MTHERTHDTFRVLRIYTVKNQKKKKGTSKLSLVSHLNFRSVFEPERARWKAIAVRLLFRNTKKNIISTYFFLSKRKPLLSDG
jgi:hypothetical protein